MRSFILKNARYNKVNRLIEDKYGDELYKTYD